MSRPGSCSCSSRSPSPPVPGRSRAGGRSSTPSGTTGTSSTSSGSVCSPRSSSFGDEGIAECLAGPSRHCSSVCSRRGCSPSACTQPAPRRSSRGHTPPATPIAANDSFSSAARTVTARTAKAPRRDPTCAERGPPPPTSSCRRAACPTPRPTGSRSPSALRVGGQLYLDNCAACHSAAGNGGALSVGRDAPTLHGATPVEAGEAVRTGPGNMPVFGPGTFTPQQVNSIVSYVEYLKKPQDPGGFSLGLVGPITE